MKSNYLKLLTAVSTMSWGLIDVGNEAIARLFFDQTQQELPAFTLAFLRFALAVIVLIVLALPFCNRKSLTLLKLLVVARRSPKVLIKTLIAQQLLYGAVWGISISFFVMAFQYTYSGEFIFILGLCGFTIFHELAKSDGHFNDRLIAIISFNIFIMAFYLFGVSEPLWLAGQSGTLLFSIALFIITYHFSFEIKRKIVMTDEELLLAVPQASNRQVQWAKMLIQFIAATVVALLFLYIWALDENSIQLQQLFVERENPINSLDILMTSIYVIVATVLSYFVFNYAVESLNNLSAKNKEVEDGAKVSAYLASLEPLTACLIAVYAAGEAKWYLLGSIVAFMLYMAYLNKRNSVDNPVTA